VRIKSRRFSRSIARFMPHERPHWDRRPRLQGRLCRIPLALVLGALSRLVLAQSPAAELALPAGEMRGFDGPYAMTREGSGTSWQPDSTPMVGPHAMYGEWLTMLHGMADLIDDHQGGPRGATQTFSSSVLMFMARRALSQGACGIHAMASGDPTMGASGYPLLFQTGETADGHTPLIDRQHPHNLLMEAAVSCSRDLGTQSSLFIYAGAPGEPALGPNAFMHRLSGMDNPEAPLSHHWLDSTHISGGVVTGGYSFSVLQLELSAFNGREPDQHRYEVEVRGLDSYAARLSYNPTPAWSMQVSSGRLASPEQLEPGVSVRRSTASASYDAPLGTWWQTTLAWGRNSPSSGQASDAWLLESAFKLGAAHTLFGRLERVGKDELFVPGEPLYGPTYTINKLSLGYIYDFLQFGPLQLGLGGLASGYRYAAVLDSAYGTHPLSFMVFVRARL
jgi:hypothetical protein